MNTESFWEGTAPAAEFEALSGNVAADVCVIGGGITGITAAQLLLAAGKRVVVLEARTVGSGTTGYSTGNLHVIPDDGLRAIAGKWDQSVASAVAASRAAVIDHIERTVAEFGIDCGFARRPHFIFALDGKQEKQMSEERDAAQKAGLAATVVAGDQVALPRSIGAQAALWIENQAQFHPMAYTRLLACGLAARYPATVRIYEGTPAVEIDSDKGIVRTPGGSVTADHIIEATHTPKGFNLLQTDLGPYREYAIAARLSDGAYPVGIFWSLESPGHSIRSYDFAGERYLVVIGEKHKTGQHEEVMGYYEAVEAYARRHFSVTDIVYHWSGQHYRPADGVPYVGKTVDSGRVFVATGFGTSGLLYGPVAAQIIADQILRRENPMAAIFDAKRFTPAKSAQEFVKENANVAEQYARGWLTRGAATAIDRLQAPGSGQGCLVDVDGHKVAVYMDEQGELVTLSPVCTHLQCIVHWNDVERSWDCPCHGSRFACTGEVLEGPALAPLERLSAK
jgi:glycine/D-amino acid oxidase-like deaminating enzyme/nitrite reductase/ring-hydroxylating ferredoxin subunit